MFFHHVKLGVQSPKLGVQLHSLLQRGTATGFMASEMTALLM